MNVNRMEIQIRPTYESLCNELGYDPMEFGDPDKINPVMWGQGERTELLAVEPGESFEIARGFEGCISEPEDTGHCVRIIDPACPSSDDEITDTRGLPPGRYLYDGRDVKVVERFPASHISSSAGEDCPNGRMDRSRL